jgi:hypothetical protein
MLQQTPGKNAPDILMNLTDKFTFFSPLTLSGVKGSYKALVKILQKNGAFSAN